MGFAIDSAEPKRPFTGSASPPPHTQHNSRTLVLSFLNTLICTLSAFSSHTTHTLGNLRNRSLSATLHRLSIIATLKRTIRVGITLSPVRVTFLQEKVNIPNLTFLTNRVLFSYDHFLIKLILLGDCAVSCSELPLRYVN